MIVAAAYQMNGLIYSMPAPARHGDIIAACYDVGGLALCIDAEQGFLDSQGHFLNRAVAMKSACACGQISKQYYNNRVELYSEDLW